MGIGDVCLCDFFEIRDGNWFSNYLLVILCGDKCFVDLYLSGLYFWVRFKLDKNGFDFGFMVRFFFVIIVEGECFFLL